MGPSEELAGGMNTKKKFQVLEMTDVSQAKTAIAAAEDDLKRLKLELSTSMSTKHKLQEYKKELEDDCNLLKFEKAAKEAECKTLRLKVEILEEIFEQQRTAAEEKLELKMRKRQECQMWLSEEEEKMNMAAEEVMNYMQRIEEMELKLQQTESLYVQQISFYEVMAHDSWLRAHALERELIEQIRQVAELKHRLEITQSKKPQEEGDIKTLKPVKPDVEDFPQRDPGPGAAPSRKSSSGSSFPAKGGKQTPPQKTKSDSSPSLSRLTASPQAVSP
ncbi:transport and Golgi organization protein 1 homolog [Tamandua tetradactyla]|uniref:transport and Golgi organization protein 1 homolog n=1 Tax=Tamandua tetradactyla TaxID=48850 RepID=UPI0040548357